MYSFHLEDLKRLERKVKSLFKDFLSEIGFGSHNRDASAKGQDHLPTRDLHLCPKVDAHETDNEIIIKCDLPGAKKEDIHFELYGDNMLYIRAETKLESSLEKGKTHIQERRHGIHSRFIPLPSTANTDEIDARFDHGVLTTRISKKEETKLHKINLL
ncbi:hypothetical protein G9A89_017871 [Geosiphon pyriformis]|nr:hypothetical protein G9A89_017871 [Geosiphon pyriformis]